MTRQEKLDLERKVIREWIARNPKMNPDNPTPAEQEDLDEAYSKAFPDSWIAKSRKS